MWLTAEPLQCFSLLWSSRLVSTYRGNPKAIQSSVPSEQDRELKCLWCFINYNIYTALLKKITRQTELNGDSGVKVKHSAELTEKKQNKCLKKSSLVCYQFIFLSVKAVALQLPQKNVKMCYFPSEPPHTYMHRYGNDTKGRQCYKRSLLSPGRVAWWLLWVP